MPCTLEPMPIVLTDLDAWEIDDLRRRLESLLARIMRARTSGNGGGPASTMDVDGQIHLEQRGDAVIVTASPWGGTGGLRLSMPVPAAEGHLPTKISRLKRDDLIRLISTWLAMLDHAGDGLTTADPQRSPAVTRLRDLVSAVVRAANTHPMTDARFEVTGAPMYRAEGGVGTGTRLPGITLGNRPLLKAEVERMVIDLHPGAEIARSDHPRSFRLIPPRRIVLPVAELDGMGIMRALAGLDLRSVRKPVLAAGLALR